MDRLFMNKENRDRAWRESGGKRSSVRNQLLHPMYVEDYESETGHVLTQADKGFGNSIYQTHFSVLYELSS